MSISGVGGFGDSLQRLFGTWRAQIESMKQAKNQTQGAKQAAGSGGSAEESVALAAYRGRSGLDKTRRATQEVAPMPVQTDATGSAMSNLEALRKQGIAQTTKPGHYHDKNSFQISDYGTKGDGTAGWQTREGLGSCADNKLRESSLALSPDLAKSIDAKCGDVIYFKDKATGELHKIGVYDDTTARDVKNRIDVYNPNGKSFLDSVSKEDYELAKGENVGVLK